MSATTMDRSTDERRAAQALAALAKGNEIRTANAKLKRDIAALSRSAARTRVIGILREPSGPVRNMRLGGLLLSMPAFGIRKLAPLLREVGASSETPLGALTIAQRRRLVARLMEARSFAEDRDGIRPVIEPWRAKLDSEIATLRRENEALRRALDRLAA